MDLTIPPAEQAAAEGVTEEPRFFIDHDMIHDRITGRHVHGDRSIDAGIADEAVFMLNELHASALREIKRYTRASPRAEAVSDERVREIADAQHLKPFPQCCESAIRAALAESKKEGT